MKDIDEYEALRNLNPSTDKLGRERDFHDHINIHMKWATERINDIEQKLKDQNKIIKNVLQRLKDECNFEVRPLKGRKNDSKQYE